MMYTNSLRKQLKTPIFVIITRNLYFNHQLVLLATGAGFSADSGLAVYKDIADVEAYHKEKLTYMSLCDPRWITDDPEIFYGFWGSCFNSYRDTKPHKGYEIIGKWKSKFFEKKYMMRKLQNLSRECSHKTHEEELTWMEKLSEKMANLHFDEKPLDEYPGSFFVYTSNVDNHTFTSGLTKDAFIEIHGYRDDKHVDSNDVAQLNIGNVVNLVKMFSGKGPAISNLMSI